jgi:hypothetical protein
MPFNGEPVIKMRLRSAKGSFINDFTVFRGEGYQGFCDDSNKVLLLKSVTIRGGGIKKRSKIA